MQQNTAPSVQLGGSKVASIIACNTIMLALASFGACVRVTAQVFVRRFDPDDVFFLLSWIFGFVLCFTSMWMIRYGYGRHFTLIENDMETVTTLLKLDFVTAISYLISLNSIKISFCLLYLKVFSVTRFRWLYYAVMAFVGCEFIEETFVFIFQCSPVSKLFYPDTTGVCIDLYVFYFVSFGIKLVTDITLFVLPIPQLLKLRMRRGAKVGLILMFGLGLLVCVTSIIRITYIRHFHIDFTWELVQALNWSSVEVCTAIIIASIPSFRIIITRACPVLRKTFRTLSSDKSRQEIKSSPTAAPLNEDYFTIPMS